MIFITLGSQKFQFDRLLKAVDELVADGTITEPVFAQSGYSDYQPKHYAFKQFLDRDGFAEQMGKADIVITHGGTGAIIGAVKKGKKVIAVPRLAKYGEHVDDHQLQLLKEFKQMDIICVCDDCSQLAAALDEVRYTEYKPFVSNTRTIINSIDGFIRSEVMGEATFHKSGNIRVLMIGNDSSVKGGITSVISQLLDHDWAADGVNMKFIPTYIAANPVKKILFFEKALRRIRGLLANPQTRPDVVHIHMSYKGSFVQEMVRLVQAGAAGAYPHDAARGFVRNRAGRAMERMHHGDRARRTYRGGEQYRAYSRHDRAMAGGRRAIPGAVHGRVDSA